MCIRDRTLAELYDKWTAAYFPTLESESSCRTIKSAWCYCHAIAGMRVKDLRARHIKGIMEDGYIIPSRGANKGEKVLASAGTKSRIKSMFNLMLDYALEYELVDKNLSLIHISSWIALCISTDKIPHLLSSILITVFNAIASKSVVHLLPFLLFSRSYLYAVEYLRAWFSTSAVVINNSFLTPVNNLNQA